ncbi:MAG: alpha/beta fold hydrolase [Jatrophihabitantaceae bacterium]
MLSSLAPARRRLVYAVVGVVLIAVVVAAIELITAGDPTPTRPVSQVSAGPVLLVPGYGGSTTALDALAVTLRAAGKDVTVVSLPGNARGDLNAQATVLGTAVTQVLARTQARSVDIVGYSAGGVVARLWVRNDGGASLARRVITLGSPHHGTDLASLAGSILPGICPTACQQLAVDSPLLAALNSGDETPPGPSFVSIWTTHDDVVLPADSASLGGALDVTVQSVCASDPVRHSGLPTDRVVQAMVAAELAPGPPVTLRRGDCARFSS